MNDNSTRARADRQTQRRVVDAARESFLRVGYIGTTIRGTAETAGVALLDRRRDRRPRRTTERYGRWLADTILATILDEGSGA